MGEGFFTVAKTTKAKKAMTGKRMRFIDWIEQELKARRWRQTDLAQAAGISDSTVSLVLNAEREAGPDFCNGIAKAFGIPPEVVFRMAGILPPLPGPEEDAMIREVTEGFKQLSVEKRREVLNYVMWQLQQSRSGDMPKPEDSADSQKP